MIAIYKKETPAEVLEDRRQGSNQHQYRSMHAHNLTDSPDRASKTTMDELAVPFYAPKLGSDVHSLVNTGSTTEPHSAKPHRKQNAHRVLRAEIPYSTPSERKAIMSVLACGYGHRCNQHHLCNRCSRRRRRRKERDLLSLAD